MANSILYIDMDAFFASIEQRDNPALRGKPVIIGALPGEKRGVVSTASYEARKYGVHSAMPTALAFKLCPNGYFMRARISYYQEVSEKIMRILGEYSPRVIQRSIDEAMLDLTGTERLFGAPRASALAIKKRVHDETGLTISAGLAANAYIAKMASEVNKPDGFYEVAAGDEEEFMLHRPLEKVWGVGSATYARLKAAGLKTARDVHGVSLDNLTLMLGKACGNFLYNAVRGREAISFDDEPSSHSISSERTFPTDITDIYAAETAIMEMCHTVYFRMLSEGVKSSTVTVKLRYGNFETLSGRESGGIITSLDDLFDRCRALFERKYDRTRGLRLLGAGVDNTTEHSEEQRDLFTSERDDKRRAVENAIARMVSKDNSIKIQKGRAIQTPQNSTP